MKCTSCGNEQDDGYFCMKCGAKLYDDTTEHVCHKCSCKYTGNFCPMCGTAFATQYPHSSEKRFIYSCFSDSEDVLWNAKYQYDNVHIFRPDPSFSELFEYDTLDVIPEPTNPYDSKAISLVFCGNVIGYLYRGTLQDMVHDFLNRGDLVKAQVQTICGELIGVKLFFCCKRSALLPPIEHAFSVKLISNSSEEFQSNISYLNIGDSVDIEFDSEKDTYLVTCDGSEIGYIPDRKSDDISIREEEGYFAFGNVSNIDYSDSGKANISIDVCFE